VARDARDPGNSGGQPPAREGGRLQAPLSEWIVASVSTLLVLGMLFYLLSEGIRRPQQPAALVIRTDSIVEAPAGYLVMITLRNDGGETAANVLVHAEVASGAQKVEESEVTVDYVPVAAERSASLQFTNDPRQHRLTVRISGFMPP
jgi:uncharacterized protein (TIGR02588 family)